MTGVTGGSVLGLPTPLARLYGTAMETGMTVTETRPASDGDEAMADTAAVVSFGSHIALAPGLDDDLQACVMAMALAVACSMVRNPEDARRGDICAPGGYVVITRDRQEGQPDTPGRIATLIAQRCGQDTESAAFDWYLPDLDDARNGQ